MLALVAPLVLTGLTGSSFAFFTSQPEAHSTGARIFTEGLNIELDRTSPAFAALEDAWLGDELTRPAPEPKASEVVALIPALAPTGEKIAQEITRENRREEALITQERASREAAARALAQAAVNAFKKLTADSDQAAAVSQSATVFDGSTEPSIRHETRTISLTDLKMSREELIGSLFFPIAKSDPAVANQNPRSNPSRPSARALAPTGDRVQKESASAAPSGEPVRQVIIAGQIELADGMALSNPLDRLVVYRELDGEAFEAGNVWIREGRYEIFVEETIGDLLAELRTPYGDILGRGSFDLANLRASEPGQRKIDQVPLRIRPVTQGVTGLVQTRNFKTGQEKPVPAAQVFFRDLPFGVDAKANGRFEEANLSEGSSVMLKVTRPGYWGTMALARAGSETTVELLSDQPNQVIEQLVKMASPRGLDSTQVGAIVYGRVQRAGRPIAGAKVDLMTTSEALRPIYFNTAMLPDPSLTSTSANGLYAFYPIPDGAHAVQVWMDGQLGEPMVFPAESRTVTRLDIETGVERRARVRVFDAFRTDWPLPAELSQPGSTRKPTLIETQGTSEIRFADGPGLLVLDARSGPAYERVRLSVDRDRRTLFFPMIQSKWLEEMRQAMSLYRDANAGIVVGFVQGNAQYRVAMEEKSLTQNSRLLYFNQKGEVTGLNHGEPGGGFVLFNVPQGFRTVTIQPSGTPKVYSGFILVEPGVTNIINHAIR